MAIETVCRQKYGNWELIVADNDSQQDYQAYIQSLNDDRIKYIHSNEFISVTQNWNAALNASSGDYVIMIGDDDGLTPIYMPHVLQVIEQFNQPDFIYHGAFHYAYPQAIGLHSPSKLTDVTAYTRFLFDLKEPQFLPRHQAEWAARQALRIKAIFAFNMQHFLFHRSFITTLEKFGPFFQGPFPDFYTANMSMLLGKNIIVDPRPLTVIGISKQSYGHFHFNRKEHEGVAFLNSNGLYSQASETITNNLLPGSNMNSSWLVSVSLVRDRLRAKFPDLSLGISRYRLFQMHSALQSDFLEDHNVSCRNEIEQHLYSYEKIFLRMLYFALWKLPFRNKLLKLLEYLITWMQYNPTRRTPWQVTNKYKTMLDVFDELEQKEID